MSSLLRSTKFVRYFTGAARTLILNSAKTAEANSLLNPKALCSANSILLRDYATAKNKENLEPLLQRLDLEVRKFGRITKRDIDEVFDEIRGKNDITSSQSLLVIRCCGQLVPEELPEQRTLLVQKIWNILSERGVPMDISHYNALLRVYIENEYNFSPAAFLEELEKKGIQPNRVTYQRLMWRYCQEGDMDGALNVLEKMRELGMPVSEPVLNALVMGHSFQGDMDGAKVVMKTMASAGLQPTNRTYTMLACGYARQGDIDAINEVIKTAKDQDILFTDKDLLEIIEHLAISGYEDKVEEIFPHLHKSIGYNQDVCNAIFRLLNKGCETTAKKVMKTMPKSNNDTMFKGAFYVKHLMKCNLETEKLIKQCRDLQNEDLVPSALYIATEMALQVGQTELAQMLFKELRKDGMEIRQHYYWPLLAQKGKEKDEEGLLQILRNMNNEGIMPTGEALRDYVIPYIMDKQSPQNVIVKLQIANVPAVFSARNLIVNLLDAGDIKKAASIALEYKPRGQYGLLTRPLLNALSKTKDVESFATILHVISSNPAISQTDEDTSKDDAQAEEKSDMNGLGRLIVLGVKNLSNSDLCKELLNATLSKGLRISTSHAEEIQQFLNTNMTTEISDILSKLTSSDLERAPLEYSRRKPGQASSGDLEHLLAKAQAKGDKNVNNLKKQLIVAYMKEKQIEKLDSFLEELKTSNFEITLSTLMQLFEFYCENDCISKAKDIKAQIIAKNPEFTLNRYKSVVMAYALIRANKYDEAKQSLIENRSESDVGTPNFLLNSKCWQMVNYLAEQKEDVKVREITQALIENNYVEPSNILLGPSIKAHILKEDLEGALKEFEFCCKQYRCTPWKGELMKSLIMKEDATKLQWLADLSTQIHGEVNILHDLVLAFVECGRLKQARRILETPGLHTRQKRLETACERYVVEGKSEYLEGLLEATKELSHIDRSNIYYHLLVTYCASNETDKALGLWTMLQEDGEIPSDKFLVHLGEHLKANNREIPFVMPEVPVSKPANEKETQPIREPQKPKKPTKAEISEKIEGMVKDGDAAKAIDFAIKCIEDGVTPRSNVLKFALKQLSLDGNVEKIQALGKHIDEAKRRDITYDDKLTQATFNKGAGKQHVDGVLSAVNSANTKEDLEVALRKFPRGVALAAALKDKEMAAQCHKIAVTAASKGHTMPANLLWMEYLLNDLNEEANTLWNSCLAQTEAILFRRLLQEAHTQKKPEIIEKLINVLHTNESLSPASIGNAYSRLINYYLSENELDKAQATLNKAIEKGISKEHFNKTTLQRLLTTSEAAGKKIEFTI